MASLNSSRTHKAHLLIVDADNAYRQSFTERIGLYGMFELQERRSGAQMLQYIDEAAHLDAVILDNDLPDLNGCELCRLARIGGATVPMVILAPFENEDDLIRCLDAGATDYVVKSSPVGVLLARLQAHLRQHAECESATFTVGPYTVDSTQKALVAEDGGTITRLTAKEFDVLRYLRKHSGKIVSRTELLKKIWGYNPEMETHTVETHIYKLRRKIEADPSNPAFLITYESGYGLRSLD